MTDPAPAIDLAALNRQLHIWLLPLDQAPLPTTDNCLHLLDQEEKERFHRFHFELDRLHYLAAHAMQRLVLSHYLPCPPESWQFTRGTHGKPDVVLAAGMPPLRCNLSHTQGMVGCVVALERDCGIDIERIRLMKDMRGVAATVFSESEIAWLERQPESEQAHTFFALWTLKEALIKATGQGFSAPLKKIGFDLTTNTVAVDTDDGCVHASTNWLLHRHQPAASHAVAIAAAPRAGLETLTYRTLGLAANTQDVHIKVLKTAVFPA